MWMWVANRSMVRVNGSVVNHPNPRNGKVNLCNKVCDSCQLITVYLCPDNIVSARARCHLYYTFWRLQWNQAGTGRAVQKFWTVFNLNYVVLQISATGEQKQSLFFLLQQLMPTSMELSGNILYTRRNKLENDFF